MHGGAGFFNRFRKVFSTPTNALIFISYCLTFCVILILTGLSKKKSDGSYDYDPMVVVILTEFGKLACSVGLSFKLYNFGPRKLVTELFSAEGRRAAMLYLIPATLYVIYNNLAFVNLLAFDPTTYTVLTQFRIVLTGVAFQIFFKRKLTRLQWLSLAMLTLGCIVKEVGAQRRKSGTATQSPDGTEKLSPRAHLLDPMLIVLLIQVAASSSAGVYNEFLLKEKAASTPLMLQNIYMCLNSIAVNFAILFALGNGVRVTSSLGTVLSQPVTLSIAAAGTVYGLITSVLLKELNSVLKTYAAAVEIFVCGVGSHLLLGTAVDRASVAALVIVSYACYLYVREPVVSYGARGADPTTDAAGKERSEDEESAGTYASLAGGDGCVPGSTSSSVVYQEDTFRKPAS